MDSLRSCLFLVSFFSLIACTLVLAATTGKKQIYIVYLGGFQESVSGILAEQHNDLLSLALGSLEEGTQSVVYNYKHSFNGYAASLSEKQAKLLSELQGGHGIYQFWSHILLIHIGSRATSFWCMLEPHPADTVLEPQEAREMPQVVSVFPNTLLSLHTTRSWDFLGDEIASVAVPWQQSKVSLGQDVIVGVLDTGCIAAVFIIICSIVLLQQNVLMIMKTTKLHLLFLFISMIKVDARPFSPSAQSGSFDLNISNKHMKYNISLTLPMVLLVISVPCILITWAAAKFRFSSGGAIAEVELPEIANGVAQIAQTVDPEY